jgi:MoxR-like ATPase
MKIEKFDNNDGIEQEKLMATINFEEDKSFKEVPFPDGVNKLTNCGNYSIISLKDGITYVDERGNIQPDVDPMITGTPITGDTLKRISPLNNFKDYLSTNPDRDDEDYIGNVFPADSFSQEFRIALIEHVLAPTNENYIRYGSINWEIKKNVNVTKDNKFLLVGGMIPVKTCDDDGNFEPPRNWELFPENFPKDITSSNDHVLSPTYSATITEDSVQIIKNDGLPIFLTEDKISSVGDNILIDPKDENVLFYVSSKSPSEIWKVTIDPLSDKIKKERLIMPTAYQTFRGFKLDPSGNFFMGIGKRNGVNNLVTLNRYSMKEGGEIEEITHFDFDDQERLRLIDERYTLKCYKTNFAEVSKKLEARVLQEKMSSLEKIDVFAEPAKSEAPVIPEDEAATFDGLKKQYEQQFEQQMRGKAFDMKVIQDLKEKLQTLRTSLESKEINELQINYITRDIEARIKQEETKIINAEKELQVTKVDIAVTEIRGRLNQELSFSQINVLRPKIKAIQNTSNLPTKLQQEVSTLVEQFTDLEATFYRSKGAEIEKEVQGIFDSTKRELEKLTSKPRFDAWYETELPKLRRSLQEHADNCPPTATETLEKIHTLRTNLNELAGKHNEKFQEEYAEIREKSVENQGTERRLLQHDIVDFWTRVRSKKFTSREEAETYLQTSDLKQELLERMSLLHEKNSDVAKEFEKKFKVEESQILYEIESQEGELLNETGEQMVAFGKTLFPRWEGTVERQRVPQKTELLFQENQKTYGPGVKAKDILGDISLLLTNSEGHEKKLRLWQDQQEESDWRLGAMEYRGKEVAESYLTQGEYREFKKLWKSWNEKNSSLKKQWKEKQKALHEKYSERKKTKERKDNKEEVQAGDETWKEEYKKLLGEYSTFCAENKVLLLLHVEKIANAPEAEFENGKGFVPEIKSNWVVGPEDEDLLEEMAQRLQMQSDLKEGMLDMKGHTGTGKDVILRIFAAKTNRPLFKMDCTKWTTEAELGEDLMLEVEDGATKTIKVPSAILEGIKTPGAIVYFNEFNAMPEIAQIFLHALFDESRAMTLKTRSGEVVKAARGVLFVDSRNPGYPGTFDPQWATRSRMVEMEIPYSSVHREKTEETWDKDNSNKPYAVTEALKVARSIDSLEDLTFDPNLQRNEFVRLWEHVVNGMPKDETVPEITDIQKFDLEVVLALVQFVGHLRNDFVKGFDKGIRASEKKNLLPITQPITLREMRRCAYVLSRISDEEKLKLDPERCAKDLLETEYLIKIDSEKDREKIQTWLNTQTSQKRVAVS